ncbi:hypothetical protein Tco_1346994 [Tanacetum coccineum]
MLDEVSIRCNPNCNKATSVKSQTDGPKSLQNQNQSNINTEMNESKSGRCITQNHTNTKMNESIAQNHTNTEMNEIRQQQTNGFRQIEQTDSSRFSREIRTESRFPDADRPARQYSMQNKAKPDETRRIQSQMQPT